jgi:hypothetical protein
MDRLEKLLLANPTSYKQFIMVSTRTSKAGVSDYYIGVPHEAFLRAFEGFEITPEADLPKEIDVLHIADATTDEFMSRFTMAPYPRRR